ncbi:MAG: hypothetical protein A3H72_03620 [Candidatus Doudnabacteria bacterium RIFCSPLOWO2_02_FULL_48_8]|uniref:Uncharacterized protein n=1 Tax=Candidatus Doudnabacteria bacterium RIFCSPHIGHO2_01_FULL_46_24 TaxID=1817825 RepID=A0A1F5NTG2_9BACT|nr:MAG: hypothetical protein A2720_04665 [Candidatus Doudnabacteria bacterium RIFCSPHIGHO2_01_FULL_46_24]OGE95391.1 MAG: hypothetical protein A3H72_03620 [Candidatus Doudnabacteria bacterium RIFCSPLOWO2_02_FULL_48_8]OGE95843.1 MAG: hypothetical protein A3E98_01615 [Candidatus Doudnabacteria bacterium RIFCSPHIGHO2_12_FULL_48_11]
MNNNFSKTIQRFADWAKLKLGIHLNRKPYAIYFKPRQIWWVNLGQNIGSEQNGKHKNFERPVLILKKFNAEIFLAVPLSSQVKSGAFRVVFQKGNNNFTANLSQIRVLSSKRLLRQIGKMDKQAYETIKQVFHKLA